MIEFIYFLAIICLIAFVFGAIEGFIKGWLKAWRGQK